MEQKFFQPTISFLFPFRMKFHNDNLIFNKIVPPSPYFLHPRTKFPIPSTPLDLSVSWISRAPSFFFVSIGVDDEGWDRRGWNLEKYHGREIKRNGWHDTLVPLPSSIGRHRYAGSCSCGCASNRVYVRAQKRRRGRVVK